MPTITYDGQSFMVDTRRVWIVGAGLEYARIPPELWEKRIAAAKQAGFNTISTACPWLVHEPRQGRFVFDGQMDVRRFVELCAEQGLYVILRPGPYVGCNYDGGGLPSWLAETPDITFREPNEAFLERVAVFFRRLLSQVADLQVTRTRKGAVLLVQAEQSWFCTNPELSDRYHNEVTRHIRENGITVPVVTSNDLWAELDRGIETWTGWDDMLVNLRQLRAINPDAPRIVSQFPPCEAAIWGDSGKSTRSASEVLHRLAQILATGAQPVVAPFHAGTNFGFIGGREPGRPDGFLGTSPAIDPPLGEAGARGTKYDQVKRLATFATHFGSLFADLDAGIQPVTIDLDHTTARGAAQISVVPLRSARGQVVFVFGGSDSTKVSTTLLLQQGITMPVTLGDQPVGWYLMDVDLGGVAQLDYANLCPFAVVDRSILVLSGPERSDAWVSINGSLVQTTVPSGRKPLVMEHGDITLVICNQKQIDATYVDETTVYVGVAGFDAEGQPLPRSGFPSMTIITRDGASQAARGEHAAGAAAPTKLEEWRAAPAIRQTEGTSPRYASLDGPETLDSCGTATGYGWYRVKFKVSVSKTRRCALPEVGNRLQLFLDGESERIVGAGPGADHLPFDLKLARGEHMLVGLADHTGRFAGGNDFGRRKGWFGHLYEIKPLKTTRPKVVDVEPVDPFAVRGFIIGQSKGALSDRRQAMWSFTHRKKSKVLIEIALNAPSATIVLNDTAIAYFAGPTGEGDLRLVIDSAGTEAFKRGANVLRIAPDQHDVKAAEALIKATKIYECIENITDKGEWAFARWEPPNNPRFKAVSKADAKSIAGRPCWWKIGFTRRDTTLPAWFDTTGLSKGQVFLNGHNVGRYFTTTSDGSRVGPQRRLYLPAPWFRPEGDDELMLFDEHGCSPFKTTVVYEE